MNPVPPPASGSRQVLQCVTDAKETLAADGQTTAGHQPFSASEWPGTQTLRRLHHPPATATAAIQLLSPSEIPQPADLLGHEAFTATVLLQTCGGCSVAFPWLLRSRSLHSTRTSSPRRGGTHTGIIFDATSSTQTADIPLHLPELPTLGGSLPTTRLQLGACRRRRRQPVTLLTFCPRAMDLS